MTGLIVVLAVAAFALLWWMATYNGFVAKRNQARTALSGIDVQFKKRHDLIPNLVQTVKGIMQHERTLLTQLTELRESASGRPIDAPERAQLENQLGSALRTVSLRAEAYPELKSSQNFLHLQ
ncbi:MAG: LemA family protein, partial [Verrucomicrobiales bacterium]